jgi:hypothetical protein
VELEQAVVATTAVNQDIWLVLAQAQLAQVQLRVPAAELVPLEVDMADLLLAEVSPVALVQPLAINVEVPIILLAIARPRP